MFRNYLRTAIRNLWKHWGFSLLNITGLTIGMVAFFLILIYVRFELSYDSWHDKGDRIYRIVCDLKTPTDSLHLDKPDWAVPPHLVGELPEVEAAVRITMHDNWMLFRGSEVFEQDEVATADSNFSRYSIFRWSRAIL